MGCELAFDIGTGSGILAAVLARRGVKHVVATDQAPRALECAQKNIEKLGLTATVEILNVDMFPEGRASLVVCNPPWVPAQPSSPIEYAVYDPDSRMLRAFLGWLGCAFGAGRRGLVDFVRSRRAPGLAHSGRITGALCNLAASRWSRALRRARLIPRPAMPAIPCMQLAQRKSPRCGDWPLLEPNCLNDLGRFGLGWLAD
jgi:SAM-dependent methyltransferase